MGYFAYFLVKKRFKGNCSGFAEQPAPRVKYK